MKKKFEHRELEGALFLHFYINVALKIIICNKSFLCARYTSERSKIKVILLALLDHIAKTRIYAQAKVLPSCFRAHIIRRLRSGTSLPQKQYWLTSQDLRVVAILEAVLALFARSRDFVAST